jgi:hypothetical protein
VLASSLPKTLVHLDLARNKIAETSIPILHSYLKSNESTLKELILDDSLAKEYVEAQQSLSLPLSTVKIINDASWQADFFRQESALNLVPHNMNDDDWSVLFTELTKNDTIYQELHLIFFVEVARHQMSYLENLFSKQFRLTSLTIFDYVLDASVQIELFQQLRKNSLITDLRICFKIESNVFSELVDLLGSKNNIIRLDLSDSSYLGDEEAIMLTQGLNTNTVLQSLTLDQSQIGDIGFQALLSSLPSSLSYLKLEDNLISWKSLPSLLAFIKARPNFKKVCLKTNGISCNCSTKINVPDLIERILKTADTNHCICELDIIEKIKENMTQSTDNEIDLCLAQLRDDHVLELCNELKKEPNQNWSLNLQHNDRISSVGYRYLADILSSKTTIVELFIGSDNMADEAWSNLFNGLYNNKTLKKFVIDSIKLNNQKMENIGRFIQNDPALVEIGLDSCRIDADGVIHLAKVLSESSLEVLKLNQNLLGDRGCAKLLSSIPLSLTKLALNGNRITESSLQTIVSFLVNNRTLKTLEMSNNPVFGVLNSNADSNSCWQQATQASKQNNICELI